MGREGRMQGQPSPGNPQAPGTGSGPGWGLGNLTGKENWGGTDGGPEGRVGERAHYARPCLVTGAPEGH